MVKVWDEMNQEEKKETVLEEMRGLLRSGKLLVEFSKADGTMRKMYCTTDENIIPWPDNPVEGEGQVREKSKDPELFVVWDLEKESWRSFKYERVVSWEIVELVAGESANG